MAQETVDIAMKRQLIQATDAVRKKFNMLKQSKVEGHHTLEQLYEPITKVLKMSTAGPAQATPAAARSRAKSASTNIYSSSSTPKGTNITKLQWHSPDLRETGSPNSELVETYPEIDTPPSSSLDNTIREETALEGYEDSNSSENLDELVNFHIENVVSGSDGYDRIYGVRVKGNKLYIGKHEARFSDGNLTLWSGEKIVGTFKGSRELYELIFLKNPSILLTNELTTDTIKNYGKIMLLTKAPYTKYYAVNGLNVSKTSKFPSILNLLTPSPRQLRGMTEMHKKRKEGSGLAKKVPRYKTFNKNPINYIYWNNVSELIDRLRLLWSSQMSGNTGVNNEIISIIEELREEGVIY